MHAILDPRRSAFSRVDLVCLPRRSSFLSLPFFHVSFFLFGSPRDTLNAYVNGTRLDAERRVLGFPSTLSATPACPFNHARFGFTTSSEIARTRLYRVPHPVCIVRSRGLRGEASKGFCEEHTRWSRRGESSIMCRLMEALVAAINRGGNQRVNEHP